MTYWNFIWLIFGNWKFKVKVLVGLFSQGLSPWLADGCLLCSCMPFSLCILVSDVSFSSYKDTSHVRLGDHFTPVWHHLNCIYWSNDLCSQQDNIFEVLRKTCILGGALQPSKPNPHLQSTGSLQYLNFQFNLPALTHTLTRQQDLFSEWKAVADQSRERTKSKWEWMCSPEKQY